MVRIEQVDPAAAGAVAHNNVNHNVVSGEETESEDVVCQEPTSMEEENRYNDTDDDDDDEEDPPAGRSNGGGDLLYDENLDNEDEAYVYKNMRGGVRETVTVLPTPQTSSGQTLIDEGRRKRQLPMYKPRDSDAVLSCPCCFNIVCMDCQRHSRYHNQFRAIFVMGISVDWHHILVYDPIHQAFIQKDEQQQQKRQVQVGQLQNSHDSIHDYAVPPTQVESEHSTFFSWLQEQQQKPITTTSSGCNNNDNTWALHPSTQEAEYFAVECASCRTRVATLDMSQEVYHFHGCLESS